MVMRQTPNEMWERALYLHQSQLRAFELAASRTPANSSISFLRPPKTPASTCFTKHRRTLINSTKCPPPTSLVAADLFRRRLELRRTILLRRLAMNTIYVINLAARSLARSISLASSPRTFAYLTRYQSLLFRDTDIAFRRRPNYSYTSGALLRSATTMYKIER